MLFIPHEYPLFYEVSVPPTFCTWWIVVTIISILVIAHLTGLNKWLMDQSQSRYNHHMACASQSE